MAKQAPRKLAQWRRSQQMTLPQAAAHFGVTRMTYINWENGDTIPREDVVVAMWQQRICEPNDWYERPEQVPASLLELMERKAA